MPPVEAKHAVAWNADHAHWVIDGDSAIAWFYVNTEDPDQKLYFRFIQKAKDAEEKRQVAQWHADKVRIYLRSQLHRMNYDFLPTSNMAKRR